MTRSMTRWTLAGCMALAAVGAVAVLDAGTTTAEAAPSVSRFAGTYAGADPAGWWPSWAVTISSKGQITGSFGSTGHDLKGSMSGRVGDDGSYSLTVTVTMPSYDDGPRDPRVPRTKWSYASAGNMALDPAGNIAGTENTGETFVWLRQQP